MQALSTKNALKLDAQTSPAAPGQQGGDVQWAEVNNMQIAMTFSTPDIEHARKKVLGVTDVSCFHRYGFKGPKAAQWAADHELAIPSNPNSWTLSDKKSLVLRLGSSEFVIEDQPGGDASQKLASITTRSDGVYIVPRADAAFALSGSEVLNLFSELCSLDLRPSSLLANEVIMTQVAGISAIVLRQIIAGEPVYRIWCDGTYGAYMWEILIEIAVELGGGAVGLTSYQQ
jgi:sarcosine oxidase, subunit gamma